MTRKVEKAPQNGPSQNLISRINHLGNLLKHLPASLPLDPVESHYHFGLATSDVEEKGVWFAFNRNLEACFETHKIAAGGGIVFWERGLRLSDALIQTFKVAVKKLTSDVDRNFLKEVWLEHLIRSVEQQGAKIPPK
jgi:hypothetical protein